MMRALALAAALGLAGRASAVEPHRSATSLPSSNGRAAIAFDVAKSRLTTFLEHPYRFPSAGVQSRNFLFDMYPGIRVGGAGTPGTWLPDVAPTNVEYLPGTGVIHVERHTNGLRLDEYDFAPMSLEENAALVLLKVTRETAGDEVNSFFLANLHLGAGSPDPSPNGEGLLYDATRDAYYEWGDSHVAFGYGSIISSTGRTAGDKNPYSELLAGRDYVTDIPTTTGNDLVGGFQSDLGALGIGDEAWSGWYVVYAPDADAKPAVDRVKAWIANRTPKALLDAELADWSAWVTPPPSGVSADEAAVAVQSQAFLRMAQVREAGAARGQILASLPPGEWNIAWVRDMAYATVALVRTGHLDEARDAIAFQLGATVGTQADKVGMPYRISVCRYFGNGTEESDVNENGPNVEFDGFGLFLWEMDEYFRKSGDSESLATWWPAVRDGVANVLVHLQQADGLISADSSIWETHWNGQQKRFAYTTITAAKGLAAAADLATAMGDSSSAGTYENAAKTAANALHLLRADDAVLTEAEEVKDDPLHRLDGAVLEAMNFGLVSPTGATAKATVDAIVSNLTPASGHGIYRNQWGSWYDSQEWVFLDLRLARSLELAGQTQAANDLFGWNTAQAKANFGIISELHDSVTSDYAGAAPMIGFGAGAYLIRLGERGQPSAPIAGSYLAEPTAAADESPIVTFGAAVEVKVDSLVTLRASARGSDDGAGYSWTLDFGDGTPTIERQGVAAVALPHRYTRTGTFHVRATAVDSAGRSGSATTNVKVTNGFGCASAPVPWAWMCLAFGLFRRRVRPSC